MTAHMAPKTLKDEVITLRLPHHSDVERLMVYGADPALLEGVWIPGPPPSTDLRRWAATILDDMAGGWTEEGGIHGAGLVVDEADPFVGVVFFSPVADNTVELVYGVVPTARGRGIATRAAGLATTWALSGGGFDRVELRIDENQTASRSVATKLGFELHEKIETYVEGTGLTHIDFLYFKSALHEH
jgi:RimJ/RimL family protein N-acetyltransferase